MRILLQNGIERGVKGFEFSMFHISSYSVQVLHLVTATNSLLILRFGSLQDHVLMY